MNRQQREKLAHETLAILNTGSYSLPDGRAISIQKELHSACANTVLYLPGEYELLLEKVAAQPAKHSTTRQISNRTTLEAAHSLLAEYSTVAFLNFASAKNPGGGFLSGSQAQEESLARASGLYSTLQTQPDFYSFHRQLATSVYSDHLIYSPRVPVFRDDEGNLLAAPWISSFITSAAVNAGAVRKNEPTQVGNIIPVMQRRARMVLAVAALHGYEALVLGAWGCGVFQNDPASIARIFATALSEPHFAGRFAHVEFAVYDSSPDQPTYNAFKRELNL
ncbi:MAG TPA: TIGR02452 family protein [Abditibacteriaceae bacterium]|jgi:uncharacterized protein (TIGR02452 family)